MRYFQRFRNMDLEHRLTPAVMAYDVWQEKKNYGKVSMGVVRTQLRCWGISIMYEGRLPE